MILFLKFAKGLIFGILLMACSEFCFATGFELGMERSSKQIWFERFGVEFGRTALNRSTLHNHYKGNQPDLNSMKNVDAMFLFQVPLNPEKNFSVISGIGPNMQKSYLRKPEGGYSAQQSFGVSHMLGMQYELDNNISIRAHYSHHEGQLDHDCLFLGLTSRF